jgi:ribosomal protein S6--L-glutamate ligase
MRLAILGSVDSWHVQEIHRAARREFDVDVLPFHALAAKINSTSVGHNCSLDGYHTVVVRTMPKGSLEQIIVRMDMLNQCADRGATIVNPPRSLEVAIDKYLGLSRLQAAGLPVPETIICQDAASAIAAIQRLGGQAVMKPLFGSEGKGLVRVNLDTSAARLDELAAGGVFYLQRFIEHPGCDYRLLVMAARVFGMQRVNPDDWRTNIRLGGRGEPLDMTDQLRQMARAASDAVGAPFVAVDVLPDRAGGLWVLEVNAVPGWRELQKVAEIDVAAALVEMLLSGERVR